MAQQNSSKQTIHVGKNTEMYVDDANKLHLIIDLSKNFGASTSGKSEIISSTGGGVSLQSVDGVYVNCTVYKK